MQVSRIQNYNTQQNSFKGYAITRQAKQITMNNPEKMAIAEQAKRLFEYSKHIDFNIMDNFVPEVIIKQTGEKLFGNIKAALMDAPNGLRITDGRTILDFLLPIEHTAKREEAIINVELNDKVAKASHVAGLIKLSAHDYNERHLI